MRANGVGAGRNGELLLLLLLDLMLVVDTDRFSGSSLNG